MAEELEEDRPLTEEERRENLRKLLGEDKADDYFDAAYQSSYDPVKSDPKELMQSSSPVNWKILGFALAIFILVMIGAGIITGQNVQEETVDTPTSLTGQNGGAGGLPSR